MFLGLGCACLLALGFATLPRLFLLIAWIGRSPRWTLVWGGSWIWPLLGIIFLPYTTIMYMLAWSAADGGISGWSWLWIFMGILLDVMKWGAIFERRREIPYASDYVGGAP